ncbi:MAG TPA: hypothetical protein DCM62_08195 [Bacteroidales bacterium]|nr:hypothetical protein [Bacteroidales bacterium]
MFAPLSKVQTIACKSNLSETETKKVLSIELLPDGFSLLIASGNPLNFELLETYSYIDGVAQLNFSQIFRELQSAYLAADSNFYKANVLYFNPQYVLVPAELYSDSSGKTLQEFCNQKPEGYAVHADRLQRLNAYGIFPYPESLGNELRATIPNSQLFHTSAFIIESALESLQNNPQEFHVLLNIKSSHFEILLFNKGKLQYCNAFYYKTLADLMYYLFYVLEQFNKDPGQMTIALAGEIEETSANFQYLSFYFNKVVLAMPSRLPENLPEEWSGNVHRYYNLIQAALCE